MRNTDADAPRHTEEQIVGKLVWERIADHVIRTTNWQFCNEARLNGEGPVVATVCRKVLNPCPAGCSGRVFIARVHGKEVRMNWTLDWHDPASMREMENSAEIAFANTNLSRGEPAAGET